MDRKSTACSIKVDSNKNKKDRTVCKDCYNIKKRKYNNKTLIQNQHLKIENINTNSNNRTLVVVLSFFGKTYLNQDISKILKLPPDLYSNSEIKAKEVREELKPLNEYEKAIIVHDDTLGS